ncbi:MAG: UDP-N-acetylmuramate:L-alanyl-gamma-D-glutamyl-meso-diaminopimelate ligase [Desulfatibacillaceae bacterium]
MDDNNRIPEDVKRIHLIAICGTGMGALAGMLREAGYEVAGSDNNVYPPMSTFLEGRGIPVRKGFAAEHLEPPPDLVVVGNAVRRENPEAAATMERGIPYCSFPQAVNRFFAEGKAALLVTGTHGKTTTSGILAWIVAMVGLDPSFMIGGILTNLDTNHHVGTGSHIVVEGDEYDTAFFDKGPKFLHYSPSHTILTSVEFDHADIYADLEAVKESFRRLCRGLPQDSLLIYKDEDENVAEVVAEATCWKTPYGSSEKSPWRIGEVRVDAPWTRFEVLRRGEHYGWFDVRLMGRHNLHNTLAAIAVADDMRIPVEDIRHALEQFEGVYRRQQVRGAKRGVTVMDDFAHHPTAVRETLKAVRPYFPDRRIIAVFEPRTNTSKRNVFQDVYPGCFDGADLVCVREAPGLDAIPEKERFSSKKLVEDLRARGIAAHYFPDTDAIIEYVAREAVEGDLVLVMSNGGFDNIHERLLEAL